MDEVMTDSEREAREAFAAREAARWEQRLQYETATQNMLDSARALMSNIRPTLYQAHVAQALALTVIATKMMEE